MAEARVGCSTNSEQQKRKHRRYFGSLKEELVGYVKGSEWMMKFKERVGLRGPGSGLRLAEYAGAAGLPRSSVHPTSSSAGVPASRGVTAPGLCYAAFMHVSATRGSLRSPSLHPFYSIPLRNSV
jgi:hypothetical protein